MTQYSLFGSEASGPSLADLDGLLLSGAQWVRGADGARLSVVVAGRWRADALRAAFTELDVDAGGDTVTAAEGGFAVRTKFDAGLRVYATRWTRGARQGLPAGFELGAGGLRFWVIAAGRSDDAGYLLSTAATPAHADDSIHAAAGSQLARLGVAAVALTRRGPGQRPGWRVTSARRLRRLVELVGPPPTADADWPTPLSRTDSTSRTC